MAVEEEAAKAAAGTDQATGEAEGEAPAPSYRVLLRDGSELRAARVLLCCGAFTNGPSRLVPAPLRLSNFTTQTVHFSLGDGDAARLEGMPSVIAKFPTWWAYLLPPIRYPDGRTVLKLGGARVEDASAPAARLDAADRTPGRGGTRPLPEPSDLLTWYRSGGDAAARCEMEGMLHELVPGLQPARFAPTHARTAAPRRACPSSERCVASYTRPRAATGSPQSRPTRLGGWRHLRRSDRSAAAKAVYSGGRSRMMRVNCSRGSGSRRVERCVRLRACLSFVQKTHLARRCEK